MYIHRGQRKAYNISGNMLTTDGRLAFNDFTAIRKVLHTINMKRSPSWQIYPGEMRASWLLQEASLHVLRYYQDFVGGDLFGKASAYLEERAGKAMLLAVTEDFVIQFPPPQVSGGSVGAREYLEMSTRGEAHLEQVIRNSIILFLANENPANKKLKVLFDKSYLSPPESFDHLIHEVESFCMNMPPLGAGKEDIFTVLRAPFRHAPDDFDAQLDYILKYWKDYLPPDFQEQVLQGKDMMREDIMLQGGHGAAPTFVPDYQGKMRRKGMFLGKSGYDASADEAAGYEEEERFTSDIHWMPRVVLIAKNTYVWLDQLSKTYQRDIRRLDQIPDEELDRLARWNFTGLWLIGIWERSTASRKIKHRMGNPDAISSAYALYDYEVAQDLGGDEAYLDLNKRAWQRGIRLASDMVPNHTGVYSKWVIEHPDFFIQAKEPPYPNYKFSGENLSDHPHVEIRIEDGYYNKTDAAVVFERKDTQNNDVRYIYHGNDGTMMPWNDTAQLDMIKAEVREAVMQKIFYVARKFSIIRFDAAMTLAKKHFARLWYPRPGTGGDIPTRSEHAMSKKAFDALFPEEFWREVVDRINRELPETLLLAEAFWFMEGYFVRTLGMHRVYNSAFMHMLKNEENEKYRDLITNTLEFEPEILKRYVNFMSNPDEDTAIEQFGTGDKYFGICVMMNTLPGLPMFAHGQIEGFTEKYGMEYQRAYYNEDPNHWLIQKHEQEIFPLTAKRHLFSEVRHFHIYDFITGEGHINENVFAYTNRHHEEKALVMFNNKYDSAGGRILRSAPRLSGDAGSKSMASSTLAEELGMKNDPRMFYKAREQMSGLEYLFNGRDVHENGLYRHMQGFEYRVFLDFSAMYDTDGSLGDLYAQFSGEGIRDLQQTLNLRKLEPLHEAFHRVFEYEKLQHFTGQAVRQGQPLSPNDLDNLFRKAFVAFAGMIDQTSQTAGDPGKAFREFALRLESIADGIHYITAADAQTQKLLRTTPFETLADLLVLSSNFSYRENTLLLLAYYSLETVAQDKHEADMLLFERLLFAHALDGVLQQTGHSQPDLQRYKALIRILLRYGESVFDFWGKPLPRGRAATLLQNDEAIVKERKKFPEILRDPLVMDYLGVNHYQGVTYYSKESFEQLCRWFCSVSCFSFFRMKKTRKASHSKLSGAVRRSIKLFAEVTRLSDRSGYQLEILVKKLQER